MLHSLELVLLQILARLPCHEQSQELLLLQATLLLAIKIVPLILILYLRIDDHLEHVFQRDQPNLLQVRVLALPSTICWI